MINYEFKIDMLDDRGLRPLPFDPFVGFSEHLPLNEQLDNGFITIILQTEKELPIFSYLTLTISQNENEIKREWYIGKDTVTIASKFQGYYEHNIELIELTKKLEKFVGETICFTQNQDKDTVNYTIADALHRIMRIFPLAEGKGSDWDFDLPYSQLPTTLENRIFNAIDSELEDLCEQIELPQLVLNNGTIREKLDTILNVINGIARLKTNPNNNNERMLSVELFNRLKTLITNLNNNIDSNNSEINVEEYNTTLQSFAENVVQDREVVLTYPHNGYDVLKNNPNNSYLVSDSSVGIYTEYPIYSVESLIVPVTVKSYGIDDETYEIDMSKRVLEQNVYESLETTLISNIYLGNTYLSKSNTVSYKYRDNFIDLSKSWKDILFTYSSFQIGLIDATLQYLYENDEIEINESGNSTNFAFYVGSAHIGSAILRNDNPTVLELHSIPTFEPQNYQYQIKYRTAINLVISSEKSDVEQVNLKTTGLENQANKIVSFDSFSTNLLSNVLRTGNRERDVTIRHLDITSLYHNGDYTEYNEIITECEYIYFNDFIIGKYVLTKNYNRINEYIGIDSEIRQWQIPDSNSSYLRNIVINNYLELGNTLSYDDSYVTFDGKRILLEIFNTSGIIRNKIIKGCFYGSDEDYINEEWTNIVNNTFNANALYLTPVVQSGGNSISVTIKFGDNICTTIPLRTIEGDDSVFEPDKILLKKVPYCISKGKWAGFLKTFKMNLVTENSTMNTNSLPITHFNWDNDTSLTHTLIKIPDMLVLKDPSEILQLNYNLSIVSTSEYITIGKYFSIDNPIVQVNEQVISFCIVSKKYSKQRNDFLYSSDIVEELDTGLGLWYSIENENCELRFTDYLRTKFIQNSNYQQLIVAHKDPTKPRKIYLIIDRQYILKYDRIYCNFLKNRSNILYEY